MGETICFSCRRSLEEEDELRILTRACEQCFGTIFSSRDERLPAYLEALDVPAALLSRERTVLDSNGLFRHIASNPVVAGIEIGEVLDCMYTPLLGQCGETVPCLLCKVRNSVEHTWLTGEGLRELPFSFPHKVETRRKYAITTEKAGSAILLLLEPVPEE